MHAAIYLQPEIGDLAPTEYGNQLWRRDCVLAAGRLELADSTIKKLSEVYG